MYEVTENQAGQSPASLTESPQMRVNVILSFNNCDAQGEHQEIFNLGLPICSSEKDAASFIDRELFKAVKDECLLRGRDPGQLVKISTCSDWDLFEKVTGKPSLYRLGHQCKWYFGEGQMGIDFWERRLMQDYGFGIDTQIPVLGAKEILAFLFWQLKQKGPRAERMAEMQDLQPNRSERASPAS